MRMVLRGALVATGLALAAVPASARTFVSLGFGFPIFAPAPVYVAPPPVYYAPTYYAPAYSAPAYAAPAYPSAPAYTPAAPGGAVQADPTSAPYTAPNGQTCREYQTRATVGNQSRILTGTACLQPDGTWRVVR